jgi:hypothetical protein
MAILKIYPPIGVARVGNSDKFFIGPETPGVPANWDSANSRFFPFKENGKILRQAARFRIFDFDNDGNPTSEITLRAGVKIEWRINVGNRKASFFSFNGQSGARSGDVGPYVERASANHPAGAVEKPFDGRGSPLIRNQRNVSVTDRRSLEILPGEVSISQPGSKDLTDAASKTPISFLGEVQMEDSGRLLFLGGFGRTEKLDGAAPIEEYANNDGWFDDMCDGSVSATVTFPDGHSEQAQSAWVTVGPPDFAPGIGNVVSLYDTMWDIAVRTPLACQAGNDPDLQDLVAQQAAWRNDTNDFAPSYQPSFKNHIYPILARALAAFDVHEDPRRDYHGTLFDWVRLSSHSENKIRQGVFSRMRNPNSATVDRLNMPRGLGDDFTSLDQSESDPSVSPTSRAFLSVTKVQYALLKSWAENNFKGEWDLGGDLKYVPIPASNPNPTPHGLTIAALENCVGGPFFPGIEVSWLVRETQLYAGAFRLIESGFVLGPLTLGPGFFSQQMALPWQADFYDCHKEDHTPDGAPEKIIYMWWTAQRPDDIRPDANSPWRRWVLPFDANKDSNATDPDDTENLSRFEQMRTRWPELSFVVLEGDEYVEQK